MKKISFFVTTALLFCGLLLHAQQATTGTIVDADGLPIPGATVIISVLLKVQQQMLMEIFQLVPNQVLYWSFQVLGLKPKW